MSSTIAQEGFQAKLHRAEPEDLSEWRKQNRKSRETKMARIHKKEHQKAESYITESTPETCNRSLLSVQQSKDQLMYVSELQGTTERTFWLD